MSDSPLAEPVADEALQERCDYCGLSLGGWGSSSRSSDGMDEPAFCCFGCRFAATVTNSRGEGGQLGWMLARLGAAIFFTLNVMVFSMALWAEDIYAAPTGDDAASAAALHGLYRYAALFFAAPVLVILGGPLAANAWDGLRRKRITLDAFLLVGVAAAAGVSMFSAMRGSGPIYLDAACMILVCVAIGRFLEANGRWKTNQALEQLTSEIPDVAQALAADGSCQETPVDDVRIDDVVLVSPGERVPLDGVIHSGHASIDERLITGESQPAVRGPGDAIFAGSLNLDGLLTVQVTAEAGHGAVQRIVELVQTARRQKSASERLADRLTHWFVPLVMIVAVGTLCGQAAVYGWEQGFLASLAVLVVACPCALALATPLAISAAFGKAARSQLLFRDASVIERLAKVRAVCFDKTGTLTTSEPEVSRLILFGSAGESNDDERTAVLQFAAQLTEHVSHVYSQAIHRYAASELAATDVLPASSTRRAEIKTIAGRGVVGRIAGVDVALGNLACMASQGCDRSGVVEQADPAGGETFVYLGWQGTVRGAFAICETVRADAEQALRELAKLGIQASILTGDTQARAKTLATRLGIPALAELLPEDKLRAIQAARQEHGPVAMVGDGVNDAPALAAADVGFALACGTAVSRESADVCVLNDALVRVPESIALARQTLRVVKQNFAWTVGYNAIGLGLAAGGYLSPVLATLAMVGSSVLVIANSTRLAQGETAGHATSRFSDHDADAKEDDTSPDKRRAQTQLTARDANATDSDEQEQTERDLIAAGNS